MPEPHALFPGTFDPPTLGHLDLVRRAALAFARVTVGVAHHPEKQTLFSADERVELFRTALEQAGVRGVRVVKLEGLVVAACAELGAGVIARGVRSGSDLDYELPMAGTNRALAPHPETVLLPASPEHAHVSSTLVRQIAALGGDVSAFVPANVHEALARRFPGR
jgi:pantetheine-phosphate adenylyltransferase